MTRATLSVLLSFFVIFSTTTPSMASCDIKAYEIATLKLLKDHELYPGTLVAGCDWLHYCDQEDIRKARELAAKIRAFAENYKADECAKSGIVSWAEYVEYEADRGEHEVRTHESKLKYDNIGKRLQQDELRAKQLNLK